MALDSTIDTDFGGDNGRFCSCNRITWFAFWGLFDDWGFFMRKTALAILLFIYMTIWILFALASFPIYLVAISIEGLIIHLRGYKKGYWKFWKQDVRDYPWRVKAFFYGDYL